MASLSSSATSPISVVQVQQQQDRIGALPEPILLHILSFLPTLDAVRTSVLSTRWRTLWTSMGSLDLDEDNDFFFDTGERTILGSTKRKRKSKISFVEFVGKVLSFHHTPTLHKLRLICCSRDCPVEDWVRTAVSRGIQTLRLRLQPHPDPDGNARRMPSLLFMSQSLVELRLDLGGSALILPGTLALVGLRRMRLCRVKFCNDHSTRALFSSSTALRSLALEDCDYENLGCLEILCSSLQELAIEDDKSVEDGLGSCQVKIAAPQLTSFVYRASVAQAYVVEPLICLEYVKIQFQHFEVRKWFDKFLILSRASAFFFVLFSAKNLDICPVCVEALTWFRRKTSLYLIHFLNLNVLRMAVKHLDYGALRVVLKLLRLNPHLKALVVEVRHLPSVPPSSAGKKNFWKRLEACLESRNGVVEKVEIRCPDSSSFSSSEVMRYTTETVLELVRLLLRTQPRLEKLVLANRLFCDGHSTDSRRDAVMEKVLTFPRLNRGLAVAFI